MLDLSVGVYGVIVYRIEFCPAGEILTAHRFIPVAADMIAPVRVRRGGHPGPAFFL